MSPAAPLTGPPGEQQLARAALTYLAEPGDPALGALLEICEPAEILAAIKADMLPGTGPGCGDRPASRKALDRALGGWRARLPGLPGDSGLTDARRHGIRLVCPGDPEWPAGLDELDQARPYALWLRGRADLRMASLRSVAMVGSRAATGYGEPACPGNLDTLTQALHRAVQHQISRVYGELAADDQVQSGINLHRADAR